MNKYYLFLIIIALLLPIASSQIDIFGNNPNDRVLELYPKISVRDLLDLTDTPSTYPVTEGLCLKVNATNTPQIYFDTCETGGGGGDITAVIAGTGLTGGGTSGDVTLNFNTTYGDDRYINEGDDFSGSYNDLSDVPANIDEDSTNDLLISDLPLENKTLVYCGNITGATSDLCTLVDTDTDTQKDTSSIYLYNDSTIIYFNETQLNATIDSRSSGGNLSFNQTLTDGLYILQSEEGNLNVNSSNYWDNLETINDTQLENSGGELTITQSWLSAFISAVVDLSGVYNSITSNRTESEATLRGEIESNYSASISYTNSEISSVNTTANIEALGFSTGSGKVNANITFNRVVGFTSGTHNGNLSSGSNIGYIGGNALCDADYSGSHFCLEVEVMKYNTYNTTWNPGQEQVWVAKGAPGYTANANDCEGWTKITGEIAPFWDGSENSGVGAGKLTPCASELKLACCSA